MAILPYMRQLPQDYAKSKIPVPTVVVAAPQPPEQQLLPDVPILGTELPPVTGGGVEEAPTDGNTYARENAAWTDVWDGGNW